MSRESGADKALQSKRYRRFLARWRQAREEAGLTQDQVGRQLGRPQTWVSKCELGERRVDFMELEDWAAGCGKSLEWFATKGRKGWPGSFGLADVAVAVRRRPRLRGAGGDH